MLALGKGLFPNLGPIPGTAAVLEVGEMLLETLPSRRVWCWVFTEISLCSDGKLRAEGLSGPGPIQGIESQRSLSGGCLGPSPPSRHPLKWDLPPFG